MTLLQTLEMACLHKNQCISYHGVQSDKSLAGIDSIRAHHEQLTNQLFISAFNNPSNEIDSLLTNP